MITPSEGVKRKTLVDLAQPEAGTSRRREVARGVEGSSRNLLRRRAPQIASESSDELAAEEDLDIEWDPETSVIDGTASTGWGEYLPVTKTYDELPRFEMVDAEAIAAYEPVTREYKGQVPLKMTASMGVAGRTIAKAFETGAAVDEAGSEYDARTTEEFGGLRSTPELGRGDFGSAIKLASSVTQEIGAFREAAPPPSIGKVQKLSSTEPFGTDKGGRRVGQTSAELLRRQAAGREESSATATSRKGRLGTSFQRLANHRGKIDSCIWAVGLALTFVVLSWMILLVR
jgi:hypothetical protein